MNADELPKVIRQQLGPDADDATVAIVTAIAGLLMAIAYADRTVTEDERELVRRELARVHGMTPERVDVVCAVLTEHTLEIATAQVSRYTRALREHADDELKQEILGVLVDLAAIDGQVSLSEVTQLRNIAHAMGVSQQVYNELQARHRDKLTFLA